MREYYIDRLNGFSNQYKLYWIEASSKLQREFLPREVERITRKEAFSLCVTERHNRKLGADCGFSEGYIFPSIATIPKVYNTLINRCEITNRYVVENVD